MADTPKSLTNSSELDKFLTPSAHTDKRNMALDALLMVDAVDASSPKSKRVMHELLETEIKFARPFDVKLLETLQSEANRLYARDRSPQNMHLLNQVNLLFDIQQSSLDVIKALRKINNEASAFDENLKEKLRQHAEYLGQYVYEIGLSEAMDSPENITHFQEILHKNGQNVNLRNLISAPFQRGPRLEMLMGELAKRAEDNPILLNPNGPLMNDFKNTIPL